MTKLRKLLELSFHQWYWLILALMWLPLINISLRYSGFKKSYRRFLFSDKPAKLSLSNDELGKISEIAQMINIAAVKGLFPARCLSKSLLLMRILQKRQFPCQLMIGVNKNEELEQYRPQIDLYAHAWVESNHIVLNDDDNIATRFTVFPLPHRLLE